MLGDGSLRRMGQENGHQNALERFLRLVMTRLALGRLLEEVYLLYWASQAAMDKGKPLGTEMSG